MLRSSAAFSLSALVLALPASGQAPPQFRADVEQTGDTPFTGTIYVGGSRVRIEGMSNGEQMTMIIDTGAGTIMMLMPDQRAYMTMDAGSMPFEAPGSSSMDPANPCSSGEVTACESLGTENVNGYSARGWEYTRDGERETAWIAPELRFPVRIIEANGNQSDFTNVATGPQPANLFEPPANYTAMDMGGMFGGRGGRGFGAPPPGAAGRGAPPAGMPAGIPPGALPPGVDPAMLAGLGLDPATIAQMTAMATPTNSGPWEQGDGWVLEFVGNASGTRNPPVERGSQTDTYSVRFTGSVPIPYGTPAVGASVGPAWQLVPTLGSDRGLAQPLTFSWTSEFHSEFVSPIGCPDYDGFRTVVDSRGSGEMSTSDHNSMEMMMAQARFAISGDLRTFDLGAGGTATGTQTTTTTSTTQGCNPADSGTETETQTNDHGIAGLVTLSGQPLAASPGPMRGTATMPMRFEIGGFSGDLDTTVEWTLRPIS